MGAQHFFLADVTLVNNVSFAEIKKIIIITIPSAKRLNGKHAARAPFFFFLVFY